jgi:hypothetical protein
MLQVEWDITEEDLKSYDSKIKQVDDFRFVFYEPETGEIKAISNMANEQTLPSVTVTFSQVKSLLEGTDVLHNYKVVFSPDAKDYAFIRLDEQEEILQSVHDVIFQFPFSIDTGVPLEYDPTNDITVIQDYAETCWKVYINGTLARSLRDRKLYFDQTYEIYVTEFNDPNVLYKTLQVPMTKLINNFYCILPFDQVDKDEVRVSVYARKLFEKYQFIRTKI